ncbi:MAG: hypothetical protein LBK97_07195, partial [Prevotellaceae bacterium]|nr:hypothetical protein [Prevotellaceae bacterium]
MDSGTIVILLKDLIMEYNRVSLPCLGSFLSEYSPAKIVDGKIYPPSKSIVFYQNEIWNDEKLENRIAQINSVSIGVAKEELAFWIDNICVLLATGEEVLLPELGRLYVSKQAKLTFEQESENLLIESFGLKPVDIQSVELTDSEMDEMFATQRKEDKKIGTKGLIVGVLIISALAVAAMFAVFRYILTDEYRVTSSEIPAKTSDSEVIREEHVTPKYEEYFTPEYEECFTPRYGIVLSSFENFRDAIDFSRKISGTSVYCMDS